MHFNMAGLENGSNLYGERLAALVAFVSTDPGGLAAHLRNALHAAAMGADRTVRPYVGFYPCVGGGFIVEVLGVENGLGHDEPRL